jgi:hypothetical protein
MTAYMSGTSSTGAPPLLSDELEHTLDAKRPSDGWRWLATNLLDQVVIATATTNCSLRSQSIGHELKHGQVVIVHSTNETRIDAVGNLIGIENGSQGIEMRQRGIPR